MQSKTSFLLEFSMFPTSSECRDGASVSKYVTKIIDMVDKSGVNYKLTPMGTVIETQSIDEALDIVKKSYEVLGDCERVYSSLKFDIRKNCSHRLISKISSVESQLGKSVNT